MARDNGSRVALPWADTEKVQEKLIAWFGTCTAIPSGLTIGFENLPENDTGICISTRQTAFYEKRYIGGGYKAQYQFYVIYRVLPTDQQDNLDAINLLDKVGAWAEQNFDTLTISGVTQSVTRDSNAAILSVYEDGAKDYNISLTVTWEVF